MQGCIFWPRMLEYISVRVFLLPVVFIRLKVQIFEIDFDGLHILQRQYLKKCIYILTMLFNLHSNVKHRQLVYFQTKYVLYISRYFHTFQTFLPSYRLGHWFWGDLGVSKITYINCCRFVINFYNNMWRWPESEPLSQFAALPWRWLLCLRLADNLFIAVLTRTG